MNLGEIIVNTIYKLDQETSSSFKHILKVI